jgi:NADH-quinone oxidoreductase subunit H
MVEFWSGTVWPVALTVMQILLIVVPLLLGVAYATYAERKVIGFMQLRQGPMTVGPYGLLQPIADGLKLLMKETVVPSGANKVVFILAPMVTFTLAMVGWAVIPFGDGVVLANINVGVLYLFAISSLGVYGIIMAGWASNSRYAFLGALRSSAQMVSYEIAIGLIILSVLTTAGSLNLSDIVRAQQGLWFFIPHFPMFMIFIASILAETNRHPFDLPEDEATLVTGYNVEYSSMAFALFFLGQLRGHPHHGANHLGRHPRRTHRRPGDGDRRDEQRQAGGRHGAAGIERDARASRVHVRSRVPHAGRAGGSRHGRGRDRGSLRLLRRGSRAPSRGVRRRSGRRCDARRRLRRRHDRRVRASKARGDRGGMSAGAAWR